MKYVYNFQDGNKDMYNTLGGKGANLAQMRKLNLPIPSGFIISTDACKEYWHNNQQLNTEMLTQIMNEIKVIEAETGKSFSTTGKTLLVSVRSGAPISMPGMMDTILNLGLNDQTVLQFANETQNPQLAYDCYRRLIQMYANVVMDVSMEKFEQALQSLIKVEGVTSESGLSVSALIKLVETYKVIFKSETNCEFPQDIQEQLQMAISAVFSSWNNERAIKYREINNISADLGTAVVIQEMVFGNYNNNSATGVLFSRNPNNGEVGIYGEYLINAQGEDVVSGVRTPKFISEMIKEMPAMYDELEAVAKFLETYYRDMQDIEFTIENQKLFLLQTRNAKRSNKAKIKFLLEMVANKQMTNEEFVEAIDKKDVEAYLFAKFSPIELKKHQLFAHGLAASEGASSGKICFDLAAVEQTIANGEKAILMRHETSPEDITSMDLSEAIVTALGGMTSHAAVVARGMGKCCVCGINELQIDYQKRIATMNNYQLQEGDEISVDGTTGNIYVGIVPVTKPELDANFYLMMDIIEKVNPFTVYVNADDAKTASEGLGYGANGVGLVRTEHMFFAAERLLDMQALILSDTAQEREPFLTKMLKYQQADFIDLFEVAEGKPVAIRLLDPPLHEFLPHTDEQIKIVANKLQLDEKIVKQKIEYLAEENPMLGHRGCRLAITYPEICQMQIEAIVGAVKEVVTKGIEVHVKIIVPLVAIENEYTKLKVQMQQTTANISSSQVTIEYGVMIETPRAVLIADKLAENASFFSYGTNDLTQLTYGFSRDDVAKFIPDYFADNIITSDPFVTLDDEVAKLINLATTNAQKINPQLQSGICGEHGGDYNSVIKAIKLGLDYVSCSPRRIPIAKLAAAKAILD